MHICTVQGLAGTAMPGKASLQLLGKAWLQLPDKMISPWVIVAMYRDQKKSLGYRCGDVQAEREA